MPARAESPLVEGALCPLLDTFAAFARPDERVVQLVELEDGGRWFTSVALRRAAGAAGPARSGRGSR